MPVNIKKDLHRQKGQDLSGLVYGKVPPQATELEEAVLGACMLEKDTFEQVMPILHSGECFYVDAHQKIYNTMLEMYKRGDAIDLLTVFAHLQKINEIELIGGAHYLTQLTMAVMSSAHVVDHARVVYEKYVLREIIRISGSLITDAYSNEESFGLLDKAETQLRSLVENMTTDSAVQVGEVYTEIMFDIDDLQESETSLLGVDTGYPELNEKLKGLRTHQMIIVAARPSQGKTALAINLAEHAVTSETSPAGRADIFSLETVKKSLVRRLAAARLGIPLELIMTGRISTQQKLLMERAVSDFNSLPIFIDDRTRSLTGIIAAIRKHVKAYRKTHKGKSKEEGGLGLPYMAIIDYLQLIQSKDSNTRERQIAQISFDLKALAMELGIIIIPLAQISREAEKRGDKKPQLSDLRESGALEQDADVAIFIWHEETDPSTNGGVPGIKTHLLVLKNKDGKCGDVPMKFAGDIQRWMSDEGVPVEPASFLTAISKHTSADQQDDWGVFDNPHAGITKPPEFGDSKMFVPGGLRNYYEKDDNNTWTD